MVQMFLMTSECKYFKLDYKKAMTALQGMADPQGDQKLLQLETLLETDQGPPKSTKEKLYHNVTIPPQNLKMRDGQIAYCCFCTYLFGLKGTFLHKKYMLTYRHL